MLLSDISQSLREDIQYPDIGLHVVTLTEVVRSASASSLRLCSFSDGRRERTPGARLEPLRSKSEGPPLKSFLFDIGESLTAMMPM